MDEAGKGRRLVPVGRVTGHRGAKGEVTVRVYIGAADVWSGLARVWVEGPRGTDVLEVEHARGYRDRLVLKLSGIEDASAAAQLKGRTVAVPVNEVPRAPDGRFHAAQLVGLAVIDERGRRLGRVRDVLPTGGVDLLVVAQEDGDREGEEDLLIPLAEGIVDEVDEQRECVKVRPPDGLLELNRSTERRR